MIQTIMNKTYKHKIKDVHWNRYSIFDMLVIDEM